MAATDRLQQAIEKLTDISSELKTMIAVHEQRLTAHEKDSDEIHQTLEQRRLELDNHLVKVYDTMRDQDETILLRLESMRKEAEAQHRVLGEKINKLEKFIWMATGGGIVCSWMVSQALHFFKVLS